MTFYVNGKKESSSQEIAYFLRKCILHHRNPWTELVFLCIGTDKITGDSLGPYVGYLLSKEASPRIPVYGTLKKPVHALNLEQTAGCIRRRHPQALVVAIDASLGAKKHLGYITIENGALHPGAGVQKNLPAVGDVSITGIVNISGFLEQFTLQTTRLSTIITLADSIAEGILTILPQYCPRLPSEALQPLF